MNDERENLMTSALFEIVADGAFDFSDEFLTLLKNLNVVWSENEMAFEISENLVGELVAFCDENEIELNFIWNGEIQNDRSWSAPPCG